MSYERNRQRIDAILKKGATKTFTGYMMSPRFISNENIEFMNDDDWTNLIKTINTTNEQDLFLLYIKQLKEVKVPVLIDTRLVEMVAIMDELIREFSVYANQELHSK